MRVLAQVDGHEDFWPAYTDILMITCLVLILLAATFALSRQDDRVKQELERRKAAFEQAFNAALAPQIQRGWVRLDSPPGERQTISFSDQLLFTKGDAELQKKEGRESLAKVAMLFHQKMAGNGAFQRVQVNGHTDPDPIKTAKYPSNWHLSSARATSVVYYLVSAGIPPTRLSATGYGEFHPFTPDSAPIRDKARMRRIELVLLYPSDWIAERLLMANEARKVE